MTQILETSLYVRAYSEAPNRRPLSEIAKFKKPDLTSDWQVIFDTETTIDAAQKLRVGVCQVRKAGVLRQECLFVPDDLPDDDWVVIKAYCEERSLGLISVEDFRKEIILKIAYKANGTLIGFNLPFDIARIAIDYGIARGNMRGGFTFKLSEWKSDPHLRVKHLNATAALIDFAKPGKQSMGRGMRNRDIKVDHNRGAFVDVKTAAAALLTGRFSLKKLAKRLNTPTQKLETEEHGGPITFDYLDYARADVQATWECYDALLKMYAEFELDTPLHRILSEASVGKALLKQMNIQPLLYHGWKGLCQGDFGPIMSTYYGGRAEVRIRRKATEIIYCDFKSMYPTVNALLGLHAFLTADGFKQFDATSEVRKLLDEIGLADLKKPDVWQSLHAIVQLKPDGEALPARASYSPDKTNLTIGLNHVHSNQPLWYTLADVIASKILTGKTPIIERAIGFKPRSKQKGLRPINLLGRADYRFDPTDNDMFVSLINMRDEAKAAKDPIEKRLKILANSTCYGVFAEIIRDDHPKPKDLNIFGPDGAAFTCSTKAVEEPGRYFNPILAAMITGSARLMLACAERVAADQGLGWAFCDTDSIALARPNDMVRETFHERADNVIVWFEELNPYRKLGSILQVEDTNLHPVTKQPKPLYCWAISAKRYALFNLDAGGNPVIRKASAHGLGHLIPPYDDDDPAPGVPVPVVKLAEIGVSRWQYDLWFHIIKAALKGHSNQVPLDYHPALQKPAMIRYGATSPALLAWMRHFNAGKPYAEQIKPFGFMVAPTARQGAYLDMPVEDTAVGQRGRPRKPKVPKPIAPFDRDPAKAADHAVDRVTGERVPPHLLKTYEEVLSLYHLSAEDKFKNGQPWDQGQTKRRHVKVTRIKLIGKEANKVGDFGQNDPVQTSQQLF